MIRISLTDKDLQAAPEPSSLTRIGRSVQTPKQLCRITICTQKSVQSPSVRSRRLGQSCLASLSWSWGHLEHQTIH